MKPQLQIYTYFIPRIVSKLANLVENLVLPITMATDIWHPIIFYICIVCTHTYSYMEYYQKSFFVNFLKIS